MVWQIKISSVSKTNLMKVYITKSRFCHFFSVVLLYKAYLEINETTAKLPKRMDQSYM